jgi:hypothetical protein
MRTLTTFAVFTALCLCTIARADDRIAAPKPVNFSATATPVSTDPNGQATDPAAGQAPNDSTTEQVPNSTGSVNAVQFGDLNADGHVDSQDLLQILMAWGTCSPYVDMLCPNDLTGDGLVNIDDVIALLGHWS